MTLSAVPTVSVVVPTHDRPELVRRCVQGIADQTYEGEIEILVVFDQCAPSDLDVDLGPRRTVTSLVNTQRRPGLAGARNTGVLAATGDYLAFCDDDDLWLSTKLDAQFRRLREHGEEAACATGILVETTRRRIRREAPAGPLRHVDFVRNRIMEVNPCTLLVPRQRLLDDVGLVDELIPHGYGEDYDLVLRITRVLPVVAVTGPLVIITFHSGSYYAAAWQKMIDGLEYLLDKHPDVRADLRGSARIHGQLALAHGGLGDRRRAAAHARRALRQNPREKRAYVAAGVACGLPAQRLAGLVRRLGRGL